MPVLPDVPGLSFAANERFTAIGALKAVGVSRGADDVTYALLMGVSGAAFRVGWSPDWSLDAATVAPEDLVDNGAAWIALRAEPRKDDALEDAWDLVRGSIDAEMPVMSCGLAGAPEFCVIAGYDEEPRRFHVRGYFETGGEDYAKVEARPWYGWNHLGFGANPLVILTEAEVPERGVLIHRALSRALRFAKTRRVETHGRTLAFGEAAYGAWMESLRGLDPSGDLGLKAWAIQVNLSALADARRAASQFLRILAAMKPEWTRALRRGAEHYDHLVNVLAKAQPIVDFPRDEPAKAAEKAARNLADATRREVLAKFLWTAKQEDEEALGWVDVALHGM